MKNNYKLFLYVSAATLFTIFVIGFNYYYLVDYSERGSFGDMFGGANALFTGLSLIGLIATISLQRRDMNDQRKTANVQAFENTFFNLLNRHHEFVINAERKVTTIKKINGVIQSEKIDTKKGVDLFQKIYGGLAQNMRRVGEYNQSVYESIYKNYWDVLGHYYRNVELILKMIHENSSLSHDNKYTYIDILKSQLSEYETALLFYHFLGHDYVPYKKIAEEYKFFEFINLQLVTDDIDLYHKSARL